MYLNIRPFKTEDKQSWENINLNAKHSNFTTSLDWIAFQKEYEKGLNLYQFIMEVDGAPAGIWFVKVARRRIARIAFSPAGPVFLNNKQWDQNYELWKEIKKFCVVFCKKHNLNLFKIEPLILSTKYKVESTKKLNILEKAGFKKSLSMGGAQDTWKTRLDLKEEEQILMQHKKDTRYYIKRGKKKGITVLKATSIEDVKKLGLLMQETTSRKGFGNYPTQYYISQWEKLNPKRMTNVFIAELDGRPLAAALINYYKDTAYYAHGASTSDKEFQKLAAPYYLHYEIMLDARKAGCNIYDWWGVRPDHIKHHPTKGVSDFKKKFKGEMVSFVGSYETYSNPFKYYINRLYDWWAYRNDRYV